MGVLDRLRKLGILRFGAEKAVYHNAGERPLSVQQEGIFNSEKDTIQRDVNAKTVSSKNKTNLA